MFKLRFDTDNAAFEEDAATEVARILRDVADGCADGATEGIIRDVNGNRVGAWRLMA